MKDYNTFISENKIDIEMTLPNDVIRIAKEYHNAGKDLFVVGGACRDFIQGKQPHDYDLVTNALPEESKRILKDWNVSDEQGKNFGVLRVYTKDEPSGFEIAVYRKDISHGRDVKGDEQKVEIGNHITIEDDVKRRDITINSIFYDINKKEIIDLVGGIEDIKNNIIRAVGDPVKRFEEDRLRICRIFRFAARNNSKIDEKTTKAIKKDNRLNGISPKDDVSQERIVEEWNKMLDNCKGDTKIFDNYLKLLEEFNMWSQMFPDVNINKDILEKGVPSLDNYVLFPILFKNDKKGYNYLIQKIKLPGDVTDHINFFHELCGHLESKYVYFLYKMKQRYHVDDNNIRIYFDYFGLDKTFIESFIEYSNDPIETRGEEMIKLGFKGKEITNEIERRETERFENEYLN
ncbi:MAG: hypothetical protein WC755_09015 [Candidatus Woesearchaeota archaeon]|jgi:tRNA nucleotidyltransferase/poly(A) polymerase